MNIGVFGDSYADASLHDIDRLGWPKILIESLGCEGQIYAASGTSTWWSYEKFIEHKDKHDVIIFCYSAYSRWPVLPYDCKGLHFCVTGSHGHKKMEKFLPFYYDLLNEDFLQFQQRSIYQSVNEICAREGKYLINLQTVRTFILDVDSQFPNFYNLSDIQYFEKIKYNGRWINANESHTSGQTVDTRRCHFNDENNHIMANFLKKCIDNKSMNLTADLFRYHNWSTGITD